MRKRTIALVFTLAAACILVACGNSAAGSTSAKTDDTAQKTAQAETLPQPAAEGGETEAASSGSRAIAVYFSRFGNTDFPSDFDALSSASVRDDNGKLQGNAQAIAEWIADEAGTEIYEIIADKSYPVDYDETVDQAQAEQKENARPQVRADIPTSDSFDTVYLVFPNWWGDLPMPVYSFFDTYDFSGKTINVFITHEGSQFSKTVDTIRDLEPDADVVEGLAIRGGSVDDSEKEIRQWVDEHL